MGLNNGRRMFCAHNWKVQYWSQRYTL
jgi:hypothetical protein